jgi:hypothetical protein
MQRQSMGILENWLVQIRDVHRLHREFLDKIEVVSCFQHVVVEYRTELPFLVAPVHIYVCTFGMLYS